MTTIKKIRTIKFYKQKDGYGGYKPRELEMLENYAWSNKDAYKFGRATLAIMAKRYINNYDGANTDSRLVDAQENFRSLQTGNINTYYEDVYTYSFKVFSKKNK